MKAITIWQPWASLIMARAKRYEFREWPMPNELAGEKIVIHAAARKIKSDEVLQLFMNLNKPGAGHALDPDLARPILEKVINAHSASNPLPMAAALGTVIVGKSKKVTALFGGTVYDTGNLADDKWAWPMGGVRPFAHPIPCRGAQGLWDFPRELEPKS